MSVAQSTLKTDTIVITIREPPTFSEEIQAQVITAGVGATWTLPEIEEGDSAFAEVIVEPDSSLS